MSTISATLPADCYACNVPIKHHLGFSIMRSTEGAAILLCLGVISSPAWGQFNEQNVAEIRNMHWLPVIGLPLSRSKASLTSLPDYVGVTDAEAARIEAIAGNSVPGVEAHLLNRKTNAEAVLSYAETGYVHSDDWEKIDPREFLHEISKNTEAGNAERKLKNIQQLHVDGWVQVPTFNKDSHTASWIILDHTDDGTRSLNAIALKLGRFGSERITYIDDAKNADQAAQNLLLIANAHQFQQGARYEQYVAGSDKAAEFGIAGLVAGVMGVKLVQLAAAGGILLALKKFGFVLAFPLIWIWRKFIGRKKQI